MSDAFNQDRFLAEWGDRVFNGGAVRRAKSKRGMTGLKIISDSRQNAAANVGARAKQTRKILQGLMKRTAQVMVRVSGGGKSVSQINAHLDYISRNGQIPLEDQNGDYLMGKTNVNSLKDEWLHGGFPLHDDARFKQAFNIVLSMPAGTDPVAVKSAVREFASEEFSGYQYAMALHALETDPDSDPSPHPHVHLCVKATRLDGTRLNPRKADLQRWRERFASRLQEHGIEAAATRRLHRFQKQRGEKQALRHLRSRGAAPTALNTKLKDVARVDRAVRLELEMLNRYDELRSNLARSGRYDDRVLAEHLTHDVALSAAGSPRGGRRPPER